MVVILILNISINTMSWEFQLYNSYINDVSDRKATELFESAVFVHSYQTFFTLNPERIPFAVYALSRVGKIKIRAINNSANFYYVLDSQWGLGIGYEESLAELTNYPQLNVDNYFGTLGYLPLLNEESQNFVFRIYDFLSILRSKTFIEPLRTWNIQIKYNFQIDEDENFFVIRYGSGKLANGFTAKYGFDVGAYIPIYPYLSFSYSFYFNYTQLPVFQKPEIFEGGLRLGFVVNL